ALAGALTGAGGERLAVFVHVDPEAADRAVLDQLDVAGPAGAGVLTATLSPADLASLSDQPWVRRLQLSQPLRPLGE
ncbi:MAG: hypothetical protein ACRD0S_10495, partial [Acidimicrobiales bacterium]